MARRPTAGDVVVAVTTVAQLKRRLHSSPAQRNTSGSKVPATTATGGPNSGANSSALAGASAGGIGAAITVPIPHRLLASP
jgi:hypothetical protein